MSFESESKIFKKGTWETPKKKIFEKGQWREMPSREEPQKEEKPLDESSENVKRFRLTPEGKIEEAPWGADSEDDKKAA